MIEGLSRFEPLGMGGFARVWAAEQHGKRPVAVKVGITDSPILQERFAREVEALSRVGPPHTPEVYGHGQLEDGRPYIIMERLAGETLAERLGALPGPPELRFIERTAAAVLAALEAAHERGIIHRDLKPENIFLAKGRVVLLDFGLARGALGADALTRTGVAVGTPEYMAPEQIRGDREIDARADVYAFGVLLYELLTLRPPFVGDVGSIEHGHQVLRPQRPSDLSAVPRALEDLLLACLAKEPERRPADASALRRAFAEAIAQGSSDAAPLSGPSSRGASRSLRPKLIAAGQQPVVVLVADTSGASSQVVATMTDRGGLVVRQRGRRYVAVFSATYAADPVRAALSAARELEQRQHARAALHLAGVTIRRKERGAPTVYGAAVDRAEAWLPLEPWTGVRLTPEIERVLAESEADTPVSAAPSGDSVGSAITGQGEPPLLGRDDVLRALNASVSGAFARGSPALFTLLADHGLGKTRLAREAAALARDTSAEALVIPLRAAPLEREAGFPLAGELLGRLLGAPADPPADHHERAQAVAEALRQRARRGPLAVIVDDAHQADDAVLDALEVVTFEDKSCPLWVLVAAHPRFEAVRRSWGERTRHRARLALAPLSEAAAKELAAEQLRPAEYPPDAVLGRLASLGGGNPGSMTELVRALKRGGIVKRRGKTQSYYVATTVLDSLASSPAWQWLATRQLGALLPEIAACLRLCAVLGITFSQAELEGVLDALEEVGGAGTSADAGVALRSLAESGLLQRHAGDRWSFQTALFQDAVYETLDPAHRAEVHRAALTYFRARADRDGSVTEVLEPLARHAAAAEQRDEAADAYLRLGALAFGEHRHVDADRHLTTALALIGDDDARRRALALAGRGRCRYRIGRARDACEDLALGQALAVTLGDSALRADLLLEEATARDSWLREFDRAAERVEEARRIIEALGDPALGVRLLVAQGRICFRAERIAESIALLERALPSAIIHADYESRVIALLLLAFQLASTGRLDEAEARFEEVIALTTEAKDWPHLCGAYVNRALVWHARGQPSLVLADFRRAVDLARTFGDPLDERHAAVNGAQILHMNGESEQALDLARRACMLEERFFEEPTAPGSMLLARILLVRGEVEEVSRIVRELQRASPRELSEPSELGFFLKAFYQMLKLIVAELEPGSELGPKTPGGWDDLLSMGEQGLSTGAMSADDLLEISYWRAFMALRAGRRLEAEQMLDRSKAWRKSNPAWGARLEDLERRAIGGEAQAG